MDPRPGGEAQAPPELRPARCSRVRASDPHTSPARSEGGQGRLLREQRALEVPGAHGVGMTKEPHPKHTRPKPCCGMCFPQHAVDTSIKRRRRRSWKSFLKQEAKRG